MNAWNAGRPHRVGIAEVAKHAGVAVSSVSRVVSGHPDVSDRMRKRVLAAIEELGFVRNASARQLRSGEITTIGAVVLDIANPFFTEIARGIEDRLAADDLTLMLASSDGNPDREARYLRLFTEHGVRGVLATPSHGSIDALLAVREKGIPVVLLDHTSPVPELSSAAVDDVSGGALAIEHLLSLGHRSIAFFNGPLTLQQCIDRRDGVIQTLLEHGLDPATALIEVSMDTLNSDAGYAAAREVLAHPGVRPTAMFCVNDFTALGVLRALRESSVTVPDEVAVVGYDDVSFASMLATPLTSVRQPMHTLGWTAADILLRTGLDAAEQVVFEPELVVRESSVPATRP